MFSKRELFGGAMEVQVPNMLADASQFRVVPDHQEVFLHPSNGTCIVIELMERQGSVPDETPACARFFFSDLADANGATSEADRYIDGDEPTYESELIQRISTAFRVMPPLLQGETCRVLPPTASVPSVQAFTDSVWGLQRVSKFREHVKNELLVYIAVVRLPAPYNTDIVISVTAPQRVDPASSDAKYVTEIADPVECRAILARAVESLAVVDYGLFVV